MRLLQVHGRDRATGSYAGRTETMCSRHGVALAIIAWSLIGERESALMIVARTLAATCLQPADHLNVDLREQRRALSRDTYRLCLELPAATSSAHSAADESFPDKEAAQLIRRLRDLPPPQRDPILLCSFGGHTYCDAADLLRTTADDVAGRLTTGLRALAVDTAIVDTYLAPTHARQQ